MRTLIVGFFGFVVAGLILWLACAFVSAVWNPMAWPVAGRALYIMLILAFGVPASLGAAAIYEENLPKRR